MNDVDWVLWVNIMSEIAFILHGFALVGGPAALVIVKMSGLNNIDIVFVDELF